MMRRDGNRSLRLIAALALLLTAPTPALAALIVTSDTDGDATLTLFIEDQVQIGTTDWASVQIEIDDDEVALTAGDAVSIELVDDDGPLGTDLLFSQSFLVTAAEAAAGFVSRTFDAVFDPLPFIPDGLTDTLEVIARAEVDKDACGTFCFNDQPETSLTSVTFLDAPPPPPTGVAVVSDTR